ncbi:MAG: hypothetical protein U5J96_08035 [Ignavibacteriaceae bacterium]|nr:hypothetical protein [Ignavibacteriaceae bacterium]
MEIVTISAAIQEKRKIEFFQTIEPLKSLVKNYCQKLEIEVSPENNLQINISFESKKEMEKNFNNNEFNILKGTVRSLCDNVTIMINDVIEQK